MSEKHSVFRFVGLKILKSIFNFGSITPADLAVTISPQGVYEKKTKIYTLILNVNVEDSMRNEIIQVISESKFQFDEDIGEEIPNYFTLNAPAITFPYIRAYIATLSSISGLGTLNLPILNLVDLVEKLKTNFSISEEGEQP